MRNTQDAGEEQCLLESRKEQETLSHIEAEPDGRRFIILALFTLSLVMNICGFISFAPVATVLSHVSFANELC